MHWRDSAGHRSLSSRNKDSDENTDQILYCNQMSTYRCQGYGDAIFHRPRLMAEVLDEYVSIS